MPLIDAFVSGLDGLRSAVGQHASSRIGTDVFRRSVNRLDAEWKRTREEVDRWSLFADADLDYIQRHITWLATAAVGRPATQDVRAVILETTSKFDQALIPAYHDSLWQQFGTGYDSLLYDERPLFDEAFRCVNVECYRAAILLMWAVAASRIRLFVVKSMGWPRFNAASQGVQASQAGHFRAFNRPYTAATPAELALVPDAHILAVLLHESAIDSSEFAALRECLDRRNICGHPGRYNPGSFKVLSQADDVFNIVTMNPRLTP